MIRSILLLGWLLLAWLLWSGHSEALLLALGAASALVVLAIVRRMDLADDEAEPYELLPGLAVYVPWLLWQIARANLHVARLILSPSLPVRPRLMRVRAGQATDLGKVIHANSITLTPGTIALDVRGDTILVHALDAASAAGLRSGEMDRRVSGLERDSAGGPS